MLFSAVTEGWVSFWSADCAIRRCARVGGLNDESRMYRFFGGVEGDGRGGIEDRMRNADGEEVNDWRAVV